MLYTYQPQTVKPVLMAHIAASPTELIEAAHVGVPHVAGEGGDSELVPLLQALCGIQHDKITDNEMRASGNKIELDKHRLIHTHESTLYTQHATCMYTSAAAP
jgi:hypothetical protein